MKGQDPVTERDGFRRRGAEITRLEGFSDAVFAFAVTLLVVSLEVPKTFRELAQTMRGFLAFGVCFALLMVIWYEHYLFFRRYALQDTITIWLNSALLFVLLFYVYPLKFLFRLEFAGFMSGGVSSNASPMIETPQVAILFVIYGSGMIVLYVLLALLYAHALSRRGELALTPVEVFDTKASLVAHVLAAGIGAVSVVLALALPPNLVGLAGYAYFLFAPVMAAHGSIAGAMRRRLRETAPA